jgi:hypothetical protein
MHEFLFQSPLTKGLTMQYPSRILPLAAAIVLFFTGGIIAQITAPPTIETILSRAAEQRNIYIDEFKNLLSQETKTFETYDKNGATKKKRTVVSTFIVYQSPGNNSIGEFRNVVSVDGRKVENADKRAQDFFEEIAKVDRSNQEWERIEKEGSRYDEAITINGLTLFQAVVLADNLRPAFEFKLDSTESFAGRPVYVVSYKQVKDNRYISMDPDRMVGDGKPELVYDIEVDRNAVARVSGRFWIDAETFQIRKEERRVTVQGDAAARPTVATETTLEYQNSSFAILTPIRLTFTQYRPAKNGETRKDVAVAFSYENFTKPDVEVKSADIKQ